MENIENVISWRPTQNIRAKVIGIALHENRLLVCEVLNDSGQFKGWCPLGGGIDFCESARSALKREIYEELGCDIQIKGEPLVFENIFSHHDIKGHEIIFAFIIKFSDKKIYEKDRFQIIESNGSKLWVEWVEIEKFQTGTIALFPKDLSKKLDSLTEYRD